MLKTLLAAAALCFPLPAAAQMPDPAPAMAAEREAMRAFDWMDGHWRGQAVHRGRDGAKEVVQTERSGPMLGGTVRVVEGR